MTVLAAVEGSAGRRRLLRVAFLRVDARPLLPRLRAELTALLAGLSAGDWARATDCPGWFVRAIAAHLLGPDHGGACAPPGP